MVYFNPWKLFSSPHLSLYSFRISSKGELIRWKIGGNTDIGSCIYKETDNAERDGIIPAFIGVSNVLVSDIIMIEAEGRKI